MASLMASFQRLRAGRHAAHFRAQQAHAQHVQILAGHVHFAHVDDALHAEQRADCGGGHAVLAGAGLRDDALFAHAFGQQRLAERVVDLVRAGVQQVFALEINFCPAQFFTKALSEVERRGTAGKVVQQVGKLGLKGRIGLRFGIGVLQLKQSGHQRLRHIAAAVDAEPPGTRLRRSRWKNDRCHGALLHLRLRAKWGTLQCTGKACGGLAGLGSIHAVGGLNVDRPVTVE
jgi:hypothetical protein